MNEQARIMVGFSTAQQSTNYIPFMALNMDRFFCLETKGASDKKWSVGIAAVLKDKILILPLFDPQDSGSAQTGSDQNILHLSQFILAQLSDEPSVFFNIGGGQKPHALALWECFRRRASESHKNGSPKYRDTVVYANTSSEKIEQYTLVNNDLRLDEKAELRLQTVRLEDILKLYGFTVVDRAFTKLYRAQDKDGISIRENIISDERARFVHEPSIRRYAYKSIKLETKTEAAFGLLRDNSLVEKIYPLFGTNPTITETERRNKLDKRLSNGDFFSLLCPRQNQDVVNVAAKENKEKVEKGYGKYIEEVLAHYFINFCTQNQKNSRVAQAYVNVKIMPDTEISTKEKENATTREIGEYDILLVTDDCRLIAVDAKTYTFKKKDYDARLHNLKSAAGTFIDYVVILPYFKTDIDSKADWWFEAENKLRELPAVLTKMKTTFFALNDSDSSFFISEDGKFSSPNRVVNRAEIEIKPIGHLVQTLLRKKP